MSSGINVSSVLGLLFGGSSGLQVLGRDQNLGVLLKQLGEVLEQAVLRSEEV